MNLRGKVFLFGGKITKKEGIMKKISLHEVWQKLLNTVIIISSLYIICTSENFQEKISPKNYWKNKVSFYERTLKTDQIKIKSLELDLEKEFFSASLHKKEAFLDSKKSDLNYDNAFLNRRNKHLKNTEKLKKEIYKTLEKEKKDKKNLEIALNKIKNF